MDREPARPPGEHPHLADQLARQHGQGLQLAAARQAHRGLEAPDGEQEHAIPGLAFVKQLLAGLEAEGVRKRRQPVEDRGSDPSNRSSSASAARASSGIELPDLDAQRLVAGGRHEQAVLGRLEPRGLSRVRGSEATITDVCGPPGPIPHSPSWQPYPVPAAYQSVV